MWRAKWVMALAAMLAAPAPAAPVRVRLDTGAGPIVVAVDVDRAPITAKNFLRYVDTGRFDGAIFYRAARSRKIAGAGLIQGGINRNLRKVLDVIPHEPTSRTGLRHVDGTLSMARNAPGTAAGEFFIVVGDGAGRYLDAAPNYPGYAAFGRVVSGMASVKRILAAPTWPGGWSRMTIGQSIRRPVPIVRARRLRT